MSHAAASFKEPNLLVDCVVVPGHIRLVPLGLHRQWRCRRCKGVKQKRTVTSQVKDKCTVTSQVKNERTVTSQLIDKRAVTSQVRDNYIKA